VIKLQIELMLLDKFRQWCFKSKDMTLEDIALVISKIDEFESYNFDGENVE
jgi:hypothetical protein